MAGTPDPSGSASAALDQLCEFTVAHYHDALRRELPQIERLLDRLSTAEPLAAEISRLFADLSAALGAHLAKEENILFPALHALAAAARQGRERPALPFPTVLHPIRVMEVEHAHVHEMLDRLRAATGDFSCPADADLRWRAAIDALGAFGRDLARHVRFENDVLFPRAMEVEQSLT